MKGENTIGIPGELSSVAKGGVVSSAEGIYDYKKEATQENINERVYEDITQVGNDVILEERRAEEAEHALEREIQGKQFEIGAAVFDIVPTKDSDNLLRSGTIYEALYKLGFYTQSVDGWIRLITDADGRLIAGIKSDGSIEWYKGVPTPVKNYIAELLEGKVDKIEGKVLVDEAVANSTFYIEDNVWIYLVKDANNTFIAGIKADGSVEWYKGVPKPIKDYVDSLTDEDLINMLSVTEDETWLEKHVDEQNTIIVGIDKNGVTHITHGLNLNGSVELDSEAKKSVKEQLNVDRLSIVDDELWLEKHVDERDNVVVGIDKNGVAHVRKGINLDGNVELSETSKETLKEQLELNDGSGIDEEFAERLSVKENHTWLEVHTDEENRIIAGIDKNGVTHINKGLNLRGKVTLDDEAKESFGGTAGFDWSKESLINIPMPGHGAKINFITTEGWSQTKGEIHKATMEFWDKNGNYFSIAVELEAQGNSTLNFPIKNQTIDVVPISEDIERTIKFGDWPAQDSFHLKKHYNDVFRGQSVICYKLMEDVYMTRPYNNRRPWMRLPVLSNVTASAGIGKFKTDFDKGARCISDGFPVAVYMNGEFEGVYAICLKKDRANYKLDKDDAFQVFLDGKLDGDNFFSGNIDWTQFEVRNPKIKKDIDGADYDGDHPTEIPASATKIAIQSLANSISEIDAAIANIDSSKTAEEKLAETKQIIWGHYEVSFFIDYFLTAQIIGHTDGFQKNWLWITYGPVGSGTNFSYMWMPLLWDCDATFGMHYYGTHITMGSGGIHGNSVIGTGTSHLPTKYLYSVNNGVNVAPFADEVNARWKELRDKGIFSVEHIIEKFEDWLNIIGYDVLKADLDKLEAKNINTPSYRKSNLNTDYWDYSRDDAANQYDATQTYEAGAIVKYYKLTFKAKTVVPAGNPPVKKIYSSHPQAGGFFNSVLRVSKWLEERIAYLDQRFNYNN